MPDQVLTLRVDVGPSRDLSEHATYSNFRFGDSYSLEFDTFLGGLAGQLANHNTQGVNDTDNESKHTGG